MAGVQTVSSGASMRPVPQAEFAQVAMSGHFVQLEVPDQVEAMIRRFLALKVE